MKCGSDPDELPSVCEGASNGRPNQAGTRENEDVTMSDVAERIKKIVVDHLGVDADNPTGALGLYERNGFVVAERSTAWRRPLDMPEPDGGHS